MLKQPNYVENIFFKHNLNSIHKLRMLENLNVATKII